MATVSHARIGSLVRVRGQARPTTWNKFVLLGLVFSVIAAQLIMGGRAGSLVSVPVMFLVYVGGQFALGPRLIEAGPDEVTIRAIGRHDRVLVVATAKNVTLVRAGRCRLEAHGVTVWFNVRDWQRLTNAVSE